MVRLTQEVGFLEHHVNTLRDDKYNDVGRQAKNRKTNNFQFSRHETLLTQMENGCTSTKTQLE